jgi:hypothetical protein
MARSTRQRQAQAAWDRIEALGGHGVWESDMVVVSFGETQVTDQDLSVFRDFPFVQVLDLSHTAIGDNGLGHLEGLRALVELIVVDTKITMEALDAFRCDHPSIKVTTAPPPKGSINPFTGRPL